MLTYTKRKYLFNYRNVANHLKSQERIEAVSDERVTSKLPLH
jgi:hypothetical protein